MSDYDSDILDIIRGVSGSNAEKDDMNDDSEVMRERDALNDDSDAMSVMNALKINTEAIRERETLNDDAEPIIKRNNKHIHKHHMSVNATSNVKATSKRNTKPVTQSTTERDDSTEYVHSTERDDSTDHDPTANYNDDTHTAPLSHSLRKKASKRPTFAIQDAINKVLYQTVPISAFIQDVIDARVKNTVGIYCKKCGSDNVFSESRQTRAADEATTIFYTCLNCGNKWKMN